MKTLLALLFLSLATHSQVKPLIKKPDGTVYMMNATYQPGDTIELSGDYLWIQIKPINGTKEKPIVFRNKGKVTVGGFKGYTMILTGKHFKVICDTLGKFVIGKPGVYSMGLNLSTSTNTEVSGIEFQYLQTGIQQNPTGTMLLEDCYYHDNYFHDLGNPTEQGRSEAFYLGKTSAGGAFFKNCRIENNLIENVSGDGIQVAGGNFTIKNNWVTKFGTANLAYHQNGILVGGYASADVTGNIISNSTGIALQVLGRGSVNVIGNLFSDINNKTDAIYINGKTSTVDNKLNIIFANNKFTRVTAGRKVVMNGTALSLNGGIAYTNNIGLEKSTIWMVTPDQFTPVPLVKEFELTTTTGEKVIFQLINGTLKQKP